MSYFSLVLTNFSRAFFRRNTTISTLNFIFALILLSLWSTLVWLLKAEYQGVMVIQVTLIFQFIIVCSLLVFSPSSLTWQHYLSRQTNNWLSATGVIALGSILSLTTLVPYYFAYSSTSNPSLLILRALSLILLSLSISVFASAIGIIIKRISAPGLLRITIFGLTVTASYFLFSSDAMAILNTALQTSWINISISYLLLCVGLAGFAVSLFDWVSCFPDRVRQYGQYSGLLKSFRVFGISHEQVSVQLTNSLLRWARSGSLQYKIGVLLVCLYVIGQVFLQTQSIDERSYLLLLGVLIGSFTASISFSAVAQSRIHLYHWLPLTRAATVLTNWLAGIIIYCVVLAIIYWFSPFASTSTIGVIAVTVLITHTLSTAATYRLSYSHQHYLDRSIPIIIGGAILGIIPGTFHQVVPTDITLATLGIWLLVTLLFLRFVSQSEAQLTN